MREAKEVSEMVEQTDAMVNHLNEYEEFLNIISQAVVFLSQLLSSKTI